MLFKNTRAYLGDSRTFVRIVCDFIAKETRISCIEKKQHVQAQKQMRFLATIQAIARDEGLNATFAIHSPEEAFVVVPFSAAKIPRRTRNPEGRKEEKE